MFALMKRQFLNWISDNGFQACLQIVPSRILMPLLYAKRPICMTIYGWLNYGLQEDTTTRMLMGYQNKQKTTESSKASKNTQWTKRLDNYQSSTNCRQI